MLLRCLGVLALSLASCRADSGTASAPGHTEETSSGDAQKSQSALPGDRSDTPECGAQGRVWEGRLDGCLYEHAGCCYDTPAAACEAAGCSQESCRILESSPAQLYCA
jgi:hypothetical protein